MASNNQQNGIYLGGYSYEDKVTKQRKHVSKVLTWTEKKDNQLKDVTIATIFSDVELVPKDTPVFSSCIISFDLVRDYKSGFYKPKYTGLEIIKKS
jgi:hypothetical protein